MTIRDFLALCEEPFNLFIRESGAIGSDYYGGKCEIPEKILDREIFAISPDAEKFSAIV